MINENDVMLLCTKDGQMMVDGDGYKLIAAMAVMANRICEDINVPVEQFTALVKEKDSAPADGSSAERKEGIT